MSDSVDSGPASPSNDDQIESAGVQISERDIVFECPHCRGELVVDRDGAGLEVNCALCGRPVTVPAYQGPSLHFLQAATAKLSAALRTARSSAPNGYDFAGKTKEELARYGNELQAQLRELQAQVSEIRGLINHSRIQLHRYQLKLEMLHERQSEVKSKLDTLLGFTRASENEQPAEGNASARRTSP
jgi:ribosomal protein L37AE/L43A